MVFTKLVKAAAFGLVVASVLTLGLTDVMAQGTNKGVKAPAAPASQAAAGSQKPADVWYKLCFDTPVPEPAKPGEPPKQQKPEEMKKVNMCVTTFDLHDNTNAMLTGSIQVRQVVGQEKPQMTLVFPVGVYLPAGALAKIDDKDPIKLPYLTCDRTACLAEATIEPAILDQMKVGKQIVYLGMDLRGQPHAIPLPLEGFAKAIDGQPEPVEKFKENQQKLQEITRQWYANMKKQQEEAAANGQAAGAPAAQPAGKK